MVRKDGSVSMSMNMSTPVLIEPTTSSEATVKTSTVISASIPTSTSTMEISTQTFLSTSSTTPIGTTIPPVSTSTIHLTTTTFPSTTSPKSTLLLPTPSILTTPATPSPSPPANITIVHPPPTNHSAAILGISIGSSVAVLLLASILGIWYAHICSRTKARREEEHEIATNSQGTFVGGYNLAQLKAQEQAGEPEPKPVGVRRSNTREDGRRNGVVLKVVNPEPAPASVPEEIEPYHQTVEGGERSRARFEAFKKSRGIPTHAIDAATLYHHSEFLQSATQPQPQPEPGPETNVEILAPGVRRARSKIDQWKTGAVGPVVSIPEVKITAATPVLENAEFRRGLGRVRGSGSGRGRGRGREPPPVVKGPATFEDMGLKQYRKGLGIDLTPRSSVADMRPSIEVKSGEEQK
ncbi:uncharacterized protein LY89DRAFT_182220 [Mollisia scopiformis]|uniref:Uncharacterized protein n=1 Tax=Mollisia scopiformis TaxID=149040 RepID=A0A194XTF9_MOLSC|nr:uncharacterized protein LY89DRAFT_182220 [Mollisia scopiformis]KUJ23426.1 hypothetical protein LY89DRAFT_182220 [Mollisia scopiformis]